MNLKFGNFVEYLKSALNKNDVTWERAVFYISFSINNSQGYKFRYYNNGIEYKKVLSVFEYGPILSESLEGIERNNLKEEFNKIVILITKDDYSVTFEMDEEKVRDEKQESALMFSYYLYEKMRTQIYEYEVENNLRTPIYDEYGLSGYEDSWDNGILTFVINKETKELYHEVELYFKGEKRIVPLELTEYYKEAIWYHYEITHNELKEFWNPWNKMVVTAPKNIIPLGKEQEYIKYSLVDTNKESLVISDLLKKSLRFHTKDDTILSYSQVEKIWDLRNYPTKLVWKHKEKEVIIEDKGECFFFEIFKDKVIVLYHGRWSKNYKHPYNLYIYKADGSILHKIEAPKFKSIEMIEGMASEHDQKKHTESKIWIVPPHSKTIKNFWGKVKGVEVMQGFMDVLRKKRGKITVTISDSRYFEEQYLDVEKGEFLKTGRYIGKY